MTKVLIWLASGDRDKLMPGVLWGLNAKRNGWVDEVRVVVFGESETLLARDDELFAMVQGIEGTLYCRHLANQQGNTDALERKGAQVINVGEPIAAMIRDGFQILTF